MSTRRTLICGGIVMAGLLGALARIDTRAAEEDQSLLQQPELFQEALLTFEDPPEVGPAAFAGTFAIDDEYPAEWEFHVVRGPTVTRRFIGKHITGATRRSQYREPDGHRHEHITSGDDKSLYKPQGSSHITSGTNQSLYH
jgi:hypothetical protein